MPVLRATPVFVDSQSMLFVANDQAAVKRSVWIIRRAVVLREFVDQQVVDHTTHGRRYTFLPQLGRGRRPIPPP